MNQNEKVTKHNIILGSIGNPQQRQTNNSWQNENETKTSTIPNSFQDPQQPKLDSNHDFYNNSFQFLRLFLAFCVVISHSFALYFGNEFEPRLPLNGYYITLGNFAVFAFFVISGFVITHSFTSKPNPKEFLLKRIKRIFPGLITCLFLTVILFAPLLDSNPQRYVQNEIPNAIKYFALNATGFNLQDNIGNILGKQFSLNEINPVLWTIRYEIIAYLIVATLGFFGWFKKQAVLIMFLICNFLYWLTLDMPILHEWLNSYFMFSEMFAYLAYFFAGSTIYFFKERFVSRLRRNSPLEMTGTAGLDPATHSPKGWQSQTDGVFLWKNKLISIITIGLSLITFILALNYDLLSTFGPACIAIIILNLGYILPFQKLPKIIPDISYGVYIYGWLVQLIIIKYFKIYLSYPQYISLVIITTTLCGFASYYLVEKRFLKIAKKQ
jgi:peptidoglycan/LPS O-acetylase OafA/YrhL